MPWLSITTNDVLAALNNSELATYQQFRQAPGQPDPLATTLAHVTSEMRAHLRRLHTLDAAGGLPSSLIGPAAAITVYRLLLRCNARPGDGRKTAHDDSLKFLERIARGEAGIESPATPVPESTSAPTPRIQTPHLNFAHPGQEGI